MVCLSGYRPGGSTATNDPNSTPESDACTPSANWTGDGEGHPTPHDRVAETEPFALD
jgi:hypothetical protein